MKIRLLCLFMIALLLFGTWFIPAIIGCVLYLARFENGYEIVLVGALIDGYLGAFYAIPTITLILFVLWTAMLFLKARLVVYTELS